MQPTRLRDIARSRNRADESSLSLADGLYIAVAICLGLLVGDDSHWETLGLPVDYMPFR